MFKGPFVLASETGAGGFLLMVVLRFAIVCAMSISPKVVVRMRPARTEDAVVLRRWEKAPHLAGLLGDGDWMWEQSLANPHPSHTPFIAEVGGKPVGFLELLDTETDPERYWGGLPSGYVAIDLWIGDAAYLGKGVGREMMRQALERCFARAGIHTVLVDPLISNTASHRFYERCGFTYLGDRLFDDDACRVFGISRDQWEKVFRND